MRRVVPLLAVCGLVFNAGVLAALYVPGASYPQPISFLPFLVAFVTFGSAILVLNGGRLGRLEWEPLWDALVALPRWVQAGLGLVFLTTVAQMLFSQVGPQTDVGFERTFAAVAVWLTAVGTALHYGARQAREPGTGRRSYRFAVVAFVVVGAALAGASLLLGRDPIYDETPAHERLTARFGGAPWYPHLVAANTYHGAFIVYLDTRDATVQANACTDLKPAAAELGRVPDLYYASGGHGRFVRTC
ncbi:hypothetical protein [Dactylosporangium sp. CA-092794]|uniref:hypothetical protein n=1 Tax=Dactylosporangium sp. CA-092794 TaxID=3239929 RepID=UPI003D8D57D7